VRASAHFQFCPRCGHPGSGNQPKDAFTCRQCEFFYYFNPASAAAAFLVRPDGTVLFVRRANEPARGKWALPGGFVDLGETAEEALRREIKEEVSLEVGALEYLCSHPNEYYYKEVTYLVLDLFFVAKVVPEVQASALDGVESYRWLHPGHIDPTELAFASLRAAWAAYVNKEDMVPKRPT
jgi:ADP-ribose pyrophosphatase YjhB (NUDIX family)